MDRPRSRSPSHSSKKSYRRRDEENTRDTRRDEQDARDDGNVHDEQVGEHRRKKPERKAEERKMAKALFSKGGERGRDRERDKERHRERRERRDDRPPKRDRHDESKRAETGTHDDLAAKFGSAAASQSSSTAHAAPAQYAPMASAQTMIIVTVNDRLGTKAQIPCFASDNVGLFKAQVAARIGRKPHEIMLKRQGERPFKDMLTLEDYGVSNGVQIDLEIDTGD